jgi:hypothetical protein
MFFFVLFYTFLFHLKLSFDWPCQYFHLLVSSVSSQSSAAFFVALSMTSITSFSLFVCLYFIPFYVDYVCQSLSSPSSRDSFLRLHINTMSYTESIVGISSIKAFKVTINTT